MNIGALFYAISFFKKQTANNFVDSYMKFKEGHLTKVKTCYHLKEDEVEARKMFDLAFKYAFQDSDEIFLDEEEKENVIYYMTNGEVKPERSNIIDKTAEALSTTIA